MQTLISPTLTPIFYLPLFNLVARKLFLDIKKWGICPPLTPPAKLRLCYYSNSCTGLERPLGFREIEVSRISTQSAQEGGKVVSPTHQPPLPPGNIPGTNFC